MKKFIVNLIIKLNRLPNSAKYQKLLSNGRLKVGFGTYGLPDIHEYRGSEANITIGNYTSIGPNCIIVTGGNHPIDVISGYPFRSFFNLPGKFEDGHPYTKGDINIGSDVWIATNVTILSGVTIGDGAVILPGAIVSSNIPPYAIAGGVPAKVVKYRFDNKIIDQLLQIKWWNWTQEKVQEHVSLLCSDDFEELIKIAN